MSTSPRLHEARTFRSGAYLDSLFKSAERMNAQLQAEICARIKQARVEAGFTQDEAADLLHLTMRGYQNYESVRVPFRRMTDIAKLFNVEEDWLLHGERPRAVETDRVEMLERRLEALERVLEIQTEMIREGFAALRTAREAAQPQPQAAQARRRAAQ